MARPVTRQIHLVRHGEVANPRGVIYGRLEGFALSGRGRNMAQAAADELAGSGREIDAIISSPLMRTRQSAKPISLATGVAIRVDDDLIEASSRLEGGRYDVSLTLLAHPSAWRFLVNPLRPSWGEPYVVIMARMRAAILRAVELPGDGDVVIVSHQLPIWVMSRMARGKSPVHDPRRRRCALSSITSLTVLGDIFQEVGYRDPVAAMPDDQHG